MRIRVSECDLCGSTTVASPSGDIVAYLALVRWDVSTTCRGWGRVASGHGTGVNCTVAINSGVCNL